MVDDRSYDMSGLGNAFGCSQQHPTESIGLGDFDIEDFRIMRRMMVKDIAEHQKGLPPDHHDMDISEDVIAAMGSVFRHAFAPEPHALLAYMDAAIPIGYGKHLTDPLSVAIMTSALRPKVGATVLEVGTGLGYHSALLQQMGMSVTSCEIVSQLAEAARICLQAQDCGDVKVVTGSVFKCGVLNQKYDRIVVSAACEMIPLSILDALNPDGVLVIPAKVENEQRLVSIERGQNGSTNSRFGPATNLQSLCEIPPQLLASA